jgi:AAA+ superfamily predicted ATPase
MEQNNPVDIGIEQIEKHRSLIEKLLTNYNYANKSRYLPDMIKQTDPREEHVMTDLGKGTYTIIREGMQVFKSVSGLISDKSGLKQKLIETPTNKLDNPELNGLRDFCYNYATFASSLYITKKLEALIRGEGDVDLSGEKPDLSVLTLDSSRPEEAVMRRLLAPVYHNLIQHTESGGEVFKTPLELPVYIKEVFEKYVELALSERNKHANLNRHIEGYSFRIMDDFLVLAGYEDRSTSRISAVSQPVDFQPITAKEIAGNMSAKRKISRYVERLTLYDVAQQKNPILELGGLSWSNLFDGLPGTGKTSMFRLAMTNLAEICDQTGIKYKIFTVDQSIKDEYYGKTGKILLERLAVTNDPTAVSLGIFDDIDLLTSSRDDAQGADNDINNILMQYFDGVFTVRRGSVINFSASNKPTGLDSALRNRFNDRLLIDGPTTGEDFADILNIKGNRLIKNKLLQIELGYEPFATQDQRGADGKWTGGDVAAYMAEEFTNLKNSSVIQFGNYMAELKRKNPKITGRSMNAIMEAVKERSADFDVPREWFENRSIFLELPYDKKVLKLGELYVPITPDVLYQEARRYFDSEERFALTEAEGHVERGYNNLLWGAQAELKFLLEQKEMGDNSLTAKVSAVRNFLRVKALEQQRTIEDAIRKAEQRD